MNNDAIDVASMWEKMRLSQIRASRSVTPASTTRTREPESPTNPTSKNDSETGETICRGAATKRRVVLPLRRTFTYGKDQIRHTLDDEEENDYKIVMKGYNSFTLPSRSPQRW